MLTEHTASLTPVRLTTWWPRDERGSNPLLQSIFALSMDIAKGQALILGPCLSDQLRCVVGLEAVVSYLYLLSL